MELIGNHELEEALRSRLGRRDFDFVASAITPWHAVGVDAFTLNLRCRHRDRLKGVIAIRPHVRDGVLLDEESFRCQKWAEIEFLTVVDIGTSESLVRSIGRTIRDIVVRISWLGKPGDMDEQDAPIYLVSPFEQDYRLFVALIRTAHRFRRPIFVLLDEGLASYLPQQVMRRARQYDRPASLTGRPPDWIRTVRTTMSRVFQALAADRIPTEKFGLFQLRSDRLALSPYHTAYKKALSFRERKVSVPPTETALILSQPLSEYGWMSERGELGTFREIARALSAHGLQAVLKPHPREERKYRNLKVEGLPILPADFPAEEILTSLNPACVVGFTSTTLVVASLLYSIPSISLAAWKYTTPKDPIIGLASREFHRLTQDAVHPVRNLDDFHRVLGTLDTRAFS